MADPGDAVDGGGADAPEPDAMAVAGAASAATAAPVTADTTSESKLQPKLIPKRVKDALDQAKDFEDYRSKRIFAYLHAFSGGKDVLGDAIRKEADRNRMRCEVTSLDRKMSAEVDLKDIGKHRELLGQLRRGEYDGFHSGFPCNSFSRARWNPIPGGPPPVRSSKEIYGLSFNDSKLQAIADQGTLLATRSGWMLEAQIESAEERMIPAVGTLENPPGDEHCGPAWQLPELMDSLEKTRSVKARLRPALWTSVENHGGVIGRYPGLKFVICGKSPESEAGDVPHVMVKANTRPSVVPDVDALVVLQHVQVRECWRNTSGVIPESLVIHGLAVRELALTLPGPKRGRDAIQQLGFVGVWVGMHGMRVMIVKIQWTTFKRQKMVFDADCDRPPRRKQISDGWIQCDGAVGGV
eukprot:Skav223056  [mRNA]  locus=scaffold1069:377188:381031:+ [translate_table: standard]